MLQSVVYFTDRDPNLWLVKCRMGEEKQTAIALMRKFIAFQFSDQVLSFSFIYFSVFLYKTHVTGLARIPVVVIGLYLISTVYQG